MANIKETGIGRKMAENSYKNKVKYMMLAYNAENVFIVVVPQMQLKEELAKRAQMLRIQHDINDRPIFIGLRYQQKVQFYQVHFDKGNGKVSDKAVLASSLDKAIILVPKGALGYGWQTDIAELTRRRGTIVDLAAYSRTTQRQQRIIHRHLVFGESQTSQLFSELVRSDEEDDFTSEETVYQETTPTFQLLSAYRGDR